MPNTIAKLSQTELLVLRYFAASPDSRYNLVQTKESTRKHPLLSLLSLALCAVLSGADNFVEIHQWANAKQDWLEGRIPLPHGIPLAESSPDSTTKPLLPASRHGLDYITSLSGEGVARRVLQSVRHLSSSLSPEPHPCLPMIN